MSEKYPMSKQRADHLNTIILWWVDHDENELKRINEVAYRSQHRVWYFPFPMNADLVTLENWCYWHPQSADFWIEHLEEKRKEKVDGRS